jgi:hypothetical protein
VVIEDDSRNYDMLELGYVRIGDYVGDAREAYQGKRGYYQSSVGGQNPFRQGVLTYRQTDRPSQPNAHVKDIVQIHLTPSLKNKLLEWNPFFKLDAFAMIRSVFRYSIGMIYDYCV